MTQQTQGAPVRAESTAASREAGRSRTDPTYYLMVVPALVLFLVFLIYPFLQGIFYSFTNYAGYGDWAWIGLSNYQALFRDGIVWESYRFTFLYAVTCTILVNVFALFVAWLLNQKVFGRNGWRGFFFIPNVLPVLIVAYIFTYLFSYNLPAIGERLGIGWLSTNILANEDLAWLGVVVVGVWQATAYSTIIYLAGLQTVPEEIYEASAIDGAGRWAQFWRLTFPLIMPFFTINVVLSVKNFLGVFDQVVGMTGGGPGTSTQSVAFLIFRGGFQGGEYAYQTANGVIYFLVVLVLSVVQLWILRKREVDF